MFEGDALVIFWISFLLQIFFQHCFYLRDFIKIVRPLLAAVSTNVLKLDQERLEKALFLLFKCLWKEYWSVPNQQLSFKNVVN